MTQYEIIVLNVILKIGRPQNFFQEEEIHIRTKHLAFENLRNYQIFIYLTVTNLGFGVGGFKIFLYGQHNTRRIF